MHLRKIKPSCCIIIFLIILILFLLSHNSCDPTTTRPLKPQTPADEFLVYSRSDELQQLFRRTTMQDRSVIVTMVDQELARPGFILDLFLESFRIGEGTKPLLNHLVVVALDGKAFQYCKSVHPHCFYLSKSSERYARSHRLPLPQLKQKFWQEMIELGYSIIYTDADVMWLRNPILNADARKDMTIACDISSSDDLQNISYIGDGGFFYLKSNSITLEYFKYQDMQRFLYPNSQNRSLCEETVASKNLFGMLSLKIKYMEQHLYNWLCEQNINMNTVCIVRANCCDDTESKVHDLKLLLQDWRNFTKIIRVKGSAAKFTWRGPSKCKG